jgi:hypothetical protein
VPADTHFLDKGVQIFLSDFIHVLIIYGLELARQTVVELDCEPYGIPEAS